MKNAMPCGQVRDRGQRSEVRDRGAESREQRWKSGEQRAALPSGVEGVVVGED